MKCPCCNAEMERGELRSRGGVFFFAGGGDPAKAVYAQADGKASRSVLAAIYA